MAAVDFGMSMVMDRSGVFVKPDLKTLNLSPSEVFLKPRRMLLRVSKRRREPDAVLAW